MRNKPRMRDEHNRNKADAKTEERRERLERRRER